jgi:hypothetical protein
MNRFQAALRVLPRDLRAVSASWALVGGMAVSARSISRFTSDFDVAITVGKESEAEQIVARLLAKGYSLNVLLEDELTQTIATVRLNCPPGDAAPLLLDLLFGTSGIEAEIVDAATIETVLPGVRMPVATIGHLLAMKVLADREGRENDAGDIYRCLTWPMKRKFV